MEQKGCNIGMGYTPAGVTTLSLTKHPTCGKKKQKKKQKKTRTIGLSQDLGFEIKENSAPHCRRNFRKAT